MGFEVYNLMRLSELCKKNENWLLERILNYAIQRGYSEDASTLKEAWRLSVAGLNNSISNAVEIFRDIPELSPEDRVTDDPIASFGVLEAQSHRERGISLGMFLGLMKYYRQSYIDLIRLKLNTKTCEYYELFINRVFDRIEIAFCVEWSERGKEKKLNEMQIKNRLMTNEKNKYLTIFESLLNPVMILDRNRVIENMNHAAVMLLRDNLSPGSQYYVINDNDKLKPEESGNSVFIGTKVSQYFKWLDEQIILFFKKNCESMIFEEKIRIKNKNIIFRIKISINLDVSGKFNSIIIALEDITDLRQALNEVQTLRGILPICSYCKNIRDDEGYWQRVEEYIGRRSDADFSHSICPDCMKKYYPDFNITGD